MATNPRKALAKLLLVFVEGRNYNSMNPYMRDEVSEAFRALRLDRFKSESDTLREIAYGKNRSRWPERG
jgi:hypothetical protein